MADELDGLSEEERIKKWIAQNVPWIIAGLVIGLGGIYGYRYWQDGQQNVISSASDVYQSLVKKYQDSEDADISQELSQLKEQYPDTSYYMFGELFAAKQQSSKGDFEAAEKTLQAIMPLAEESQFADLVRTRIARVQLQAGNADDVISTLGGSNSEAFVTIAEELRGDAYVLKGDIENARTAYQAAIEGTRTQNLPLLLKLRKLPAPEVLADDSDVAASSSTTTEATETVSAESNSAVVNGVVSVAKSENETEASSEVVADETEVTNTVSAESNNAVVNDVVAETKLENETEKTSQAEASPEAGVDLSEEQIADQSATVSVVEAAVEEVESTVSKTVSTATQAVEAISNTVSQ
jgi:predicted negative regulator of RcsB-dependent stress response